MEIFTKLIIFLVKSEYTIHLIVLQLNKDDVKCDVIL